MPPGGREKDNRKRIINKREEITGKRKIFWDRRDSRVLCPGVDRDQIFPRFHNCQDLIRKIGAYD